MFPISTNEIYKTLGYIDIQRMLEPTLIYGSYPDILNQSADTQMLLRNLTDSYLYKDILATENIRKPELLDKLLRALAYQVGSEVSYNELAQTVGSDSKTVEKYIELLEKCFIIFRLNGLSRNLRNELKKAKKIYFYDNGIRNAVIQQFAPLEMRNEDKCFPEQMCYPGCQHLISHQEEYDDEPMGYCDACCEKYIDSMDNICAGKAECVF
jgi:predicted AAA+ superfamily ATPase